MGDMAPKAEPSPSMCADCPQDEEAGGTEGKPVGTEALRVSRWKTVLPLGGECWATIRHQPSLAPRHPLGFLQTCTHPTGTSFALSEASASCDSRSTPLPFP